MKTKKQAPQYKTVLDVQAIIDSNKSKNKKLLELVAWNGQGKSGSVIARELGEKWIKENFGDENFGKVEQKFKDKFPLCFETFHQVERDRHEILRDCYYYGFWREDNQYYSNLLKPALSLIPRTHDLKKESQIENCFGVMSPKIQAAIAKLESKFSRQVFEYGKFKKETGLPLRFLDGEFKGTLSEFQDKKSNLKYIKFHDSYIAIEKIEHWNKSYPEYTHGVGRLESTDRAILVSRKGKVTRYPIKNFSGNYFLKFLEENFKIPKFKFSKELTPVQLDDCFEIKKSITYTDGAIDSEVYERLLSGKLWDYCYLKDGITFHAHTVELAINGHAEKFKKFNESYRIKELIKSGKDQLVDLSKMYNKEGFIREFSLERKKNWKYLRSELEPNLIYGIMNRGVYISSSDEDIIPFLKELRLQCFEQKEKSLQKLQEARLTETWTVKKLHEKFGFCVEGIRTFCALNKIDPSSEIEGKKILEIAQKNKRINERFSYELRVLFPAEKF